MSDFSSKRTIFKKKDLGFHLSISHPSRYPTWDEIKRVRYELLPNDITVAMLLPPQDEYINIDENTFHLFEIES